MNLYYFVTPEIPCYDNDNTAVIPQQYAFESLLQLREQTVIAGLVHRDYEDKIASFGDVVNCNRPAKFKITRKTDATNSIEIQDAKLDKVQVPLDQWFYTSFVIKDGERSYAAVDLVEKYYKPAMGEIATGIDRALLGYAAHTFLPSNAGHLNGLNKDNCDDYLLEAREQLNVNNAPLGDQRSLLLNPKAETPFLKNELFVRADARGDGGEALENARLGHILDFNTFMAQNVPYVSSLTTDVTVDALDSGVSAGHTGALSIGITGYVAVAGQYMTVAGDDKPLTIASVVSSAGDTTSITPNEPLTSDCVTGADVHIYNTNTVNGSYDDGYEKAVTIDGYTTGKAPQMGQIVSFGTGAARHTYTIIQAEVGASSTDVYLDRPLEKSLSDDDVVYPGPAGSYNFAFHRNALALVTRPIALPDPSTGVKAGIASYEGLSMRVTMQYDIKSEGTVVVCGMLAGIAALDTNLGVILLG